MSAQDTVVCSVCYLPVLCRWYFCPSCGEHLDRRKQRKKGLMWCEGCGENRHRILLLAHKSEFHWIKVKFCFVCGEELQEN